MLEALATAIRPILQRIADFFDLFDLSFFVSGGISLMAVLYLARGSGVEMPGQPGVGWALACLVLAYFLGLICFAVGRSLRRFLGWVRGVVRDLRNTPTTPFAQRLYEMVSDHGLVEDDIVGTYVSRDGPAPAAKGRLYSRMWAEIRERPDLKESFDFIQHSWILAATYDGVAAAALMWAGALLLGKELAASVAIAATGTTTLPDGLLDPQAAVTMLQEPLVTPIVVALAVFAVIASFEARRHGEHQAEALIATMAHLKQSRAEGDRDDEDGGDNPYD